MNECNHIAHNFRDHRDYCAVTGTDCCMKIPVAEVCPVLDEIKPTCANCKYSHKKHDLYFKCTDYDYFNTILPIDRLHKHLRRVSVKLNFKKYDYIIINKCFGGYSWSDKALIEAGVETWNKNKDFYKWLDATRTNKKLIKFLIKKGSKYCSGRCASLNLVAVSKGIPWEIEEYDGIEKIVIIPEIEEIEVPA
jgi:hypothetical protein